MSRSRVNADQPNKIDGVPIGQTTPAAVAATTLSATGAATLSGAVALSGSVSGAALTTYLAAPAAIGGTTPAAVAATTLSASGDAALNGNVIVKAPAPASYGAATTLTAADLLGGIVQYTGAAAALTFPLATAIDTALPALAAGQGFDFSFVNTGTGAATVTANTGVTLVGAAAVTNGTSARWRLRKTATATYIAYRLS